MSFRSTSTALTRVAAALALALPSTLAAQQGGTSGAFIIRLGRDTIGVEQFTSTAQRVTGDILLRSPVARLSHYDVRLDAQGNPTRVDVTLGGLNGAPRPSQPRALTITFHGDSATQVITWPDSTSTNSFAVPSATVALPTNTSYALLEPVFARMRRSGTDSVNVNMLFFGSPRTFPASLVLHGDSATWWLFDYPTRLRVDANGRIQSVNGQETTVKVDVARVPRVDMKAVAARIATEPNGGNLGQLSSRDTVVASVGTARLWVDYGRPQRRGRTIFGGVVPWGQVWRTGANAATQFRTSVDLDVNGVTVPAGTYTLWTLPSESGTQLIVNKQTGQWGTEYDPKQDLVRIPMTTSRLDAPVEVFTIAVEPRGDAGVLAMRWGDMELSVPVHAK
ncbi:MAG TPA: DUF2911 domain-containing protein [Gemmatimonadaceae bacterium]|nr:DUF2911 domain-containing protein [Gemmatimonadaceae bacterium]